MRPRTKHNWGQRARNGFEYFVCGLAVFVLGYNLIVFEVI